MRWWPLSFLAAVERCKAGCRHDVGRRRLRIADAVPYRQSVPPKSVGSIECP
jgi:hypothetical protein